MRPTLVVPATLLFAGCAFSNVQLSLPNSSLNPSLGGGRGRAVAVVIPFEDQRAQRHRCGMQKNGFNMDTADALCDEEPAFWISSLLARELGAAGFRVNGAPRGSSSVRIEGDLLQLFVEPVIGFWSGSLEADLHVRVRIRSTNGLDATRDFFAKGIRGGQLFSVRGAYQLALERASAEIVHQMVAATVALLDRYPEASANGP